MLYKEVTEAKEHDFSKRIEINLENISKIDKEAKKKGVLLHRFLYEPYADGHAIYQIIRENKATLRIKVCEGVGDDWVIPYWGDETTIDREYVQSSINWRDNLDKLVSKKQGSVGSIGGI